MIMLMACGGAALQLELQIPGLSAVNSLISDYGSRWKLPSYDTTIPVEATDDSYWLEHIQHQGLAAFNPVSTYQVFRNVKEFGAKGYPPTKTMRIESTRAKTLLEMASPMIPLLSSGP